MPIRMVSVFWRSSTSFSAPWRGRRIAVEVQAKLRDPKSFRDEVRQIGVRGLSFDQVTRDLIELGQYHGLQVALTVEKSVLGRETLLATMTPLR
jgi:hypothetical protein